jgi:hypothetical protein
VTIRPSAAIASLAGIGLAAGLVLVGAGAAYAATAPSWEPDPQSDGSITFYDASGAQITSGDINSTIAAYYVGSTAHGSDFQAQVNAARPDPNKNPPSLWSVDNLVGASQYPITSGAPANIQTISQSHPVVTGTSGDLTLADFVAEFPNDPAHDSNTSYQNIYQIRMVTGGATGQNSVYETADLLVSGNTWTQVFPTVATATSTALTSSENPTTSGKTITLTATETPATAGSVQFKDGSNNIGNPVAVNASGVATTTISWPTPATGNPPETHNLSAVFSPTDSGFAQSTGTLTETVNPPATATTTNLAVTQNGFAGDDVKLVATVSPSTAAGTVAFYDNGATTAIPGTVTSSAGTYTLDLPSGLSAGNHSIVAKFTPTSVTQFQASQSAGQAFVLQNHPVGACAQTGSKCTDTQNIQVEVPTGTLVISTPYTSDNPLNLHTMALDETGTYFTAKGSFNDIVVTDTRSGVDGLNTYTVSAQSSPLSDGGTKPGSTINAQNVGLTGVTGTGSSGFTGTASYNENPAATPALGPLEAGTAGLGGTDHDVFTVTNSVGTFTANGVLTINAPTSTEAGIFTGTITFTVG